MLNWISHNPVFFTMVIWPILTGIISGLFKPRTPEQYAAMPAKLAAVLKLVSSLGFDPSKALEGLKQLFSKELVAPTTTAPPFASAAVKAASVPPPVTPPPAP